MKKCTMCGKEKPLSDFFRDSSRKDGRKSYCKQCAKQRGVKHKDGGYTKKIIKDFIDGASKRLAAGGDDQMGVLMDILLVGNKLKLIGEAFDIDVTVTAEPKRKNGKTTKLK